MNVCWKSLKLWGLLLLSASVLTSCKGEQQGEAIVIPPGQLFEYSNSEFISVSKSYYTMELLRYDNISKEFYAVADITPTTGKEDAQDIRYVIPKGNNQAGLYIIRASLTMQGMGLSAIVTSQGQVTPSIASNLLVELIRNYPGFDVATVTDDTVNTLTAEIERAIERAKLEFETNGEGYSLKVWYRFLQNYVSRDPGFLDLAKSRGFEFNVASSGMVESAPFPFGKENKRPILDAGNSTPNANDVPARENSELTLKGRATDPEADEVFYNWYIEGKLVSRDPYNIKWTPDFQAARSEPYKFTLKLSDGGISRVIDWNVVVADYNRAPIITADCPKNAKEADTWKCKVTAVDFDGDPISFILSDRLTNARIQVDGVQTDNVTRTLTVGGKTEINIEFTPNNLDARKRTAFIELTATDPKLGVANSPINLVVEDINEPPRVVMVNGSPIQTMVAGTVPHEWDHCSESDPDGNTTGYRFMIAVEDPDNLPSAGARAAEPDVVTVSVAGSLKNDRTLLVVSEADGCPVSTSATSYFCYEWRPDHVPKTGSLTLVLKDDHGGIMNVPSATYPTPITLTAEDRNQRPCPEPENVDRSLNDNVTSRIAKLSGIDNDETGPWPELVNVPLNVVPLLTTADSASSMLVFRKTRFNNTDWIHRFPRSTLGESTANYKVNLKTANSGIVTFTRTSAGTAEVIAAGVQISASSPNYKFQVAQAVTVGADDLAVTVPVKVVNQTVSANTVNHFYTAMPGFTVTNPSSFSTTATSGYFTVTRAATSSVETFPAAVIVGNTHATEATVQFETIWNTTFAIGESTKTIYFRRRPLDIPANSINTTVSGFQVQNPVVLTTSTPYTLVINMESGTTLGSDKFCWVPRLADGSILTTGTELTTTGLPADVSLSVAQPLGLEGDISISRTNSAGAQLISANTTVQAKDRTMFRTSEDVTLASGQTTASLPVRRVNHTNPVFDGNSTCFGWSDTNYEPRFMNDSAYKVHEGSAVLDFEISVTDNLVDPYAPNDPSDRHTFSINVVGVAPEGEYKICREPGNDPNNLNSPSCTSCQTKMWSYFDSARCYLRYKPTINDVSSVFTFSAQVNDNGLNLPSGTNVRSQSINIVVVENNDPPALTDLNGVPLTNSNINQAQFLGEFVEAVESKYTMYFSDPDKGNELKTIVTPTLIRTWQFLGPSNWVQRTNPSNLIIEMIGTPVLDPSGFGAKSTAQIRWKPSDFDAKRFAGTNGFVLELQVCDQGTDDAPRQCRIGFYQLKTRNINNLPMSQTSSDLGNIVFQADTYAVKDFNVIDSDLADNSTFPADLNQSTHKTRLTMCSTPGVYSCEADRSGWPVALSNFDPAYTGNAAVSGCQAPVGTLTQYKLPQFVITNSTGWADTYRRYSYQFRWCPQKSHLGVHLVYFNITDNGDEDIRGPSSMLTAQRTQVPVRLVVVAPVFFDSPKKAASGNEAVFWMRQAFSLTEYRYELLINNSRNNLVKVDLLERAKVGSATVGNPVIETRTYANPGVVATTNTSSRSDINLNTHRVFIVWKPYGATVNEHYISDPNDQTTWPRFSVKVTDQTRTTETETVNFRVQVKNPLSPVNVAPVISSYFPATTSLSIKEQVGQVFSVTASDANADVLTYRWYVDGKLMQDAGSSFTWIPKMEDAFLPTTSPGNHVVSVQVTDGAERSSGTNPNPSTTWSVKVRNTMPLPTRLTYLNSTTPWTLGSSVKERGYASSSTAITNMIWGPTAGVATKPNATTTNNHLIFTGSYTRSSVVRNFLWRLQFNNGQFTDSDSSSASQGTEALSWAVGKKSEQISFTQSTTALNSILVSSVPDPEGFFSTTGDAVTLSPSLSSVNSISPTNACYGSCAYNFFQNFASPSSTAPVPGSLSSAGTQPSAGYFDGTGTYYFYSALEGTKLKWARAGSGNAEIVTLSGNDRIGDIAVNPTTRRMYATIRDPATYRNFIYVYDISDVASGTVSLVSMISVNDGVSPDNRILDLAVDRTRNRIYALLPGTGGVVSFLDPGGGFTPQASDLQFIGVNTVSSSFSDQIGAGRKLVFNEPAQLLYGISRDSMEVFVIDTEADNFGVKVFRADTTLDEIVTYPNDGLTITINKTDGWIYLVK